MRLQLVLTVLFLYAMEATYWSKRKHIIEKERQRAVGGDIQLNVEELEANEIVLTAKRVECALGEKFPGSRNFMSVKSEIESSEVFKLIKKLPKGCSLHSHLFATTSFDYVFNNLTYRDNLYICNIDGRLKLKFLANKTDGCQLLSEMRKNDAYNSWLRSQLTLESDGSERDDVWTRFRKIFTATYDLFTYRPVFEDYVYQFLEEHRLDNVLYMEIRGPFVELYDLSGKTYDASEFIGVLWNTVQRFKRDHPTFLGAKYIYSPYRKIDNHTLRENLALLKDIMKKYPDFIVGVDFVGFEEEASLADYVDVLKHAGLQYFFHAGETNRYGHAVDENLIDAVLLGSKRIAHAFALPKHPEVMKLVKKHDIAIEISPISNQVLGLVSDLRNHPASHFIAEGLPVVICNDDPGNWEAVGLSYDWYLAFMAMSSEKAGLELLKKLALNSINYSGLNADEKKFALKRWNDDWGVFVRDVTRSKFNIEVLKKNNGQYL